MASEHMTHAQDNPWKQMQDGIELAIKEMDEEMRIHFVRQVALLSDCYRSGTNVSGVLLLHKIDTVYIVSINTDPESAKLLVTTAATTFDDAVQHVEDRKLH